MKPLILCAVLVLGCLSANANQTKNPNKFSCLKTIVETQDAPMSVAEYYEILERSNFRIETLDTYNVRFGDLRPYYAAGKTCEKFVNPIQTECLRLGLNNKLKSPWNIVSYVNACTWIETPKALVCLKELNSKLSGETGFYSLARVCEYQTALK